ncbi:4Fe-4S binding protein [bacterium]|nr:4Fe-4S binding protein [bacterium]
MLDLRIGKTWFAKPLRRTIQALCLGLFLFLFFYVCWPYGSRHHAEGMAARELIPAETFLSLDPLVAVSTSLTSSSWGPALSWAAVLLAVCLLFPRGLCSFVCPFGTLIDLFDWAVGRRVSRLRLGRGWWVYLRYGLLAPIIGLAWGGVLVAGYFAAIPVLTRGALFAAAPLQLGLQRGWYLVPPMNAGHYISLALFLGAFAVSLLGPRFWCRCLCPTGALLSVASALRFVERRVSDSCIQCGKCADACSFDAIRGDDYSTRTGDCASCQDCGPACPVDAISFRCRALRRHRSTDESGLSRRGLLLGSLAGAMTLALERPSAVAEPVVRAPGSLPEEDFLRLCVRCGACMKACPFSVLQPAGLGRGMWTPKVKADWAGCEPSCTNCGQACPTGAIRPLALAEKRVARMGLAVVNETTCLPYAGAEACQLCVDECTAAGYNAIEFLRVGVEIDDEGLPVLGSGLLAPSVLADKCVGCGICQSRCYGINVKQKHALAASAIVVEAGEGKEDRIRTGSYLALRETEQRHREEQLRKENEQRGDDGGYLPDFLK